MAMAEAEGSVTFSLDFTDAGIYYDGVLTYILDPSFMDDDGGDDCDFSCEGEYDDYNDYGIEPSDIYCECCHEDWPLDDICEGDDTPIIYFEKEDYADYTDPENWDHITGNVAITRADNQGLFNAYLESSYNESGEHGPAGTLWAPMSTEEATMQDSSVYTSWNVAMNSDPGSFIGDTVSLWCLEEDEYYNIMMVSWTGGNNGGGFAYNRQEVHVDGEDDDDADAGLIIMNMNLMEFFMVMFGADIDSLGIENPTAIALFGEDTVEYVEGIVFGDDTTMIELNTEDVAGAISIGENTVAFSNLILQDSTGVNTMYLNGTIGPGSIDLVAGEETSLDFFNDLFEDDDEGEFYLSFNEDSTGMGVEIEYDDYYGEEYADTSNFDWIATADSLFLYFEGDEYYGDEADTIELAYAVHDVTDDGYFDSLFVNASFEPCEEDDYDSYDDCFEDMELFGLDELEDVESFRVYEELVFSSGGFTSVAPGDGTMPNEFNLYGNYPNPFNPVTSIRFDVGLKSGNNTSLLIYDITGRNVATLINEQLQTGTYEVKWDARGFASGIYFSELISGTNRHTQKMVLLK
jgi:hypothetical protein